MLAVRMGMTPKFVRRLLLLYIRIILYSPYPIPSPTIN